MVSIIIPTLNEEEYLPRLLESVRCQRLDGIEMIVADAGSTDRTVEIAKRFGCLVVSGGLPGKGRNEGAKAARGDEFLFVDADVVLPDGFLKKFLWEIHARGLDGAGCALRIQEEKWVYKAFQTLLTAYFWITQWKWPHVACCFFATRAIHEKIHGFDETVVFAEDHDYVSRIGKAGKFGFVPSVFFYASARRAEREGIMLPLLKYLFAELYIRLFGQIRTDLLHYRFGHYKKKA